MGQVTIRAACVDLLYRAAGSSIQAMFSWVHCVGGSCDGFRVHLCELMRTEKVALFIIVAESAQRVMNVCTGVNVMM